MANISLKDYLEQVDSMVREGAFDEAIFHCRHILQRYPKNITAYRILSAALLGSSKWEAAGDAFLRVLSVVPDDVLAHYGLGQVYQHLEQHEQAVWHMERAYEQEPTNQQFVKGLRELYFAHYGLREPRFQLTTGAVVQQYARNNLYEQAIESLITVLDDMPDRVDLQLLLARIYLEIGARYDAADVALDVLEALPDCLEANIIIARMWLTEQRPSDAQRFLSRIEALDPYLAMELASGQTPDDYQFRLPEADYQAAARRRITEAQPDWLSAFEDVSLDLSPEQEAIRANTEMPAIRPELDELEHEEGIETDSWLDEIAGAEDLDVSFSSAPPPLSETRKRTGLTGLLAALQTNQADEEPDDIMETGEQPIANIGATLDLEAVKPAAEPTAGDEAEPVIGDEDEDHDPLAWMPADDEYEQDEAATEAPAREKPGTDFADPFAWMHASGIELADEPQAEIFDPHAVEDDGGQLQDPTKVDTLEWLRKSGVEVDTGALARPTFEEVEEPEEEDALAWLGDAALETEEQPAAPSSSPSSWLDDDSLLEEMLSMEALTGDDDFLDEPLFTDNDDLGQSDADEPALAEADLSQFDFDDENDLADEDQDDLEFNEDDPAAKLLQDDPALELRMGLDEARDNDIVDLLEPPGTDLDDEFGFEDSVSDFFSELDDDSDPDRLLD